MTNRFSMVDSIPTKSILKYPPTRELDLIRIKYLNLLDLVRMKSSCGAGAKRARSEGVFQNFSRGQAIDLVFPVILCKRLCGSLFIP